ncbi:MAG TPA: ABC transporter substrate-binding protein [Stenomitos sp.]
MLTRRKFQKLSFLSLLAFLKGCSSSNEPNLHYQSTLKNTELLILWERGYLPEESKGIIELVQEWQHLSRKKVNLKLVSDEFIEQSLFQVLSKSKNAIIPDIIFSVKFNSSIAPILAWQDKLLDLSDVIKPIESRFKADALSKVIYRNLVGNNNSYYALPIGLSDAYIHYWKDSLAEIGYDESDIPKEWNQFWQFWQTAHTRLKSQHHHSMHGLGLCLSANGFDTSAAFQMLLEAQNVTIMTPRKGLVISEPRNRQRFIDVITELTDFYLKGYIPPEALEWSGSGNNIAFLNHRVLMTLNMTLSIPRSQKLENNQYNQNAAQRYQEIGTLATYPNKIDGTPMYGVRTINQILAPKHSRHPKQVLDFLSYLLKPNNIKRLVSGFNGRILPTMPELLNDPLWQDASDPHLAAALGMYHQPRLSEAPEVSLLLSQIYTKQLWAQILHQTIQANTSPTQAADWGIAQINTIWEELEKYV